MVIDLNPTIYGKKLFPSEERVKEAVSSAAKSVKQAAQGFGSMLGQTQFAINPALSVPAAIAATRQTASQTPLLGTGPMFGLRGNQQPVIQPQPAQQPYNYGLYAATAGLPSFDVTKTQTPFSQYSASAPQQLMAGLTQSAPPIPAQLPMRVSAPEAINPNQARPMAGFARISDWSQNPLVQAARATGDISAIQRATEQARNQGRGTFQPNDISGVSLAALRTSNPEAGFGGSRTPAQQQALLAQMRQRGAEIARANIASQERFFTQKREERNFQPYNPTPTTIAGIQGEFQQFRRLGDRTPAQYGQGQGIGGSVYSSTPFAQQRARESVSGYGFGMAPTLSQQTLTAMRGGGPQPKERIAGLGSSFSNYG